MSMFRTTLPTIEWSDEGLIAVIVLAVCVPLMLLRCRGLVGGTGGPSGDVATPIGGFCAGDRAPQKSRMSRTG